MPKGKQRAPIKKRSGPSPDILRKGSAHRDRTKYYRKQKHGNEEDRTFRAHGQDAHHVYRQGHLRPIRRARVELNKFEQAVEQAMEWIQDNGLKLEK